MAATSPKALAADETLDNYLNPAVVAIGAREQEEVIKLMRKLPSGTDIKKLHDALIKMGAIKLFRFSNSVSEEYIPVLQEAMKTLGRDTFNSKMMLTAIQYALDKDFSQPGVYDGFREIGSFLQYIDTLQFPIEDPAQFSRSDTLITPAVAEAVQHVLSTVQYTSRDIRAFNSFVYAAGKANLPLAKIIEFQVGQGNKLYEMNVFAKALKPNISLDHTAESHAIVNNKLKEIQQASLAYRFAAAIGLDPEPDQKWSIKADVNGNGGFVTTEVSNMWNDCIQLVVKGPKGQQKGNERHGVLVGNAFRPIDLLQLRTEMEEIGHIFGLENPDWKKATITVKGFDKTAVKDVKKWMGI